MPQDGPNPGRRGRGPQKQQPSDPRINQVISALRKPWVEGQQLQIINGVPTWGDAPAPGGGGLSGGVENWAKTDQTFVAGAAVNVSFTGSLLDTAGSAVNPGGAAGTQFYPDSEGWWQAHGFVELTLGAAGSDAIMVVRAVDDTGIIRQSGGNFPVDPGFGEFYGTHEVTMEPVYVTDPANTYFMMQVTSANRTGGSGSAGTVWGFPTFGSGTRTRMGIFKVG